MRLFAPGSASSAIVARIIAIGRPLAPPVTARAATVSRSPSRAPAARPTSGFPAVPRRSARGVAAPIPAARAGVPAGRQCESVTARAALAGENPFIVRRELERGTALATWACIGESAAARVVAASRAVLATAMIVAIAGSSRRRAAFRDERRGRLALRATDLEHPVVAGRNGQRRTALRAFGARTSGRRVRGDLFSLPRDRRTQGEGPLYERRDTLAARTRARQHARLLNCVGDLGTATRARTHVVHQNSPSVETS
jgi:hypothetical protein